MSRRSALGLGIAAISAVGLAACSSSDSSGSVASSTSAASSDPAAIATDAYVFGYPLVVMDVTRENAAPTNRFFHGEPPTPEDKSVVRLNLDTLYSFAWLDVRAEPMVLQVPAMESDRYWLMQIMDAWSNTVQDPSSVHPQVKSGSDSPPFTYAITGPGWSGQLPEGVTQLQVPTGTVWVAGRLQFNGGSDVDRVRELQRQLKLVPLSTWVKDPAAVQGDPGLPNANSGDAAKTVAQMDGPAFFDRMTKLMAANPPAAADADALKRFASIGITKGGSVNGVSAEVLNTAVKTGSERIPTYKNPAAEDANGWIFDPTIGAYGTNYGQRALVAMQGLGANLSKDALYPTVYGVADDRGTPRRFRIRFAAGQQPPVDAFWSITAYDGASHLVDNPAQIYSVGHQIKPTEGPDGSLEIAVQSADPGDLVPKGNWLPIPASGQFSLTMRLYAPKSQAADGGWQPPKLEQLS
ncbi:DUF1254 domain-containing protein [Nocardia sp. NPDC004340]